MIVPGDQNQFSSSFAPLGDLLKTLMFFSNLNNFNSSPLPSDQRFAKRKGSSNVWKKKKTLSDLVTFSLSLPLLDFFFFLALLVCFAFLFLVSLALCIALFNMFLFVYFSILFYFAFHKYKNKKKIEKKKTVCVCVHWYLCTLDGH